MNVKLSAMHGTAPLFSASTACMHRCAMTSPVAGLPAMDFTTSLSSSSAEKASSCCTNSGRSSEFGSEFSCRSMASVATGRTKGTRLRFVKCSFSKTRASPLSGSDMQLSMYSFGEMACPWGSSSCRAKSLSVHSRQGGVQCSRASLWRPLVA